MCVFCLVVMIEIPIYSKDLSSYSPILPNFAQINKRGYVNKPLHIRWLLYPLEIALSLPSCIFFVPMTMNQCAIMPLQLLFNFPIYIFHSLCGNGTARKMHENNLCLKV